MNFTAFVRLFRPWPATMREEHGTVVQDRLRLETAMNLTHHRWPAWTWKACLLSLMSLPLALAVEGLHLFGVFHGHQVIAGAAEAGEQGNPSRFRDYVIAPPPRLARR